MENTFYKLTVKLRISPVIYDPFEENFTLYCGVAHGGARSVGGDGSGRKTL